MLTLKTTISEITVFSDRARVTRRGTIHLSPGEHIVMVDGLPPTLDEETVRTGGEGYSIRIIDVEVKTRFVSQPGEADLQDTEKKLIELVAEENKLMDDEAIAEARLQFLLDLRDSSSESLAAALASRDMDMADIARIADDLEGQLNAVYGRRRTLRDTRHKLNKEIQKLELRVPAARRPPRRKSSDDDDSSNESDGGSGGFRRPSPLRRTFGERPSPFGSSRLSNNASESRPPSPFGRRSSDPSEKPDPPRPERPPVSSSRRYSLHVRVEAEEETDFTLEVTYTVTSASWEPVYDIRLKDDGINVNYHALVRQQSGESWKDVPLTLSTARPAASASVPRLRPWYVDRQGPRISQFPSERSSSRSSVRRSPFSRTSGALPPGPYSKSSADNSDDNNDDDQQDIESALDLTMDADRIELDGTKPNVNYQASRRVTVSSNDMFTRSAIASLELDVELDYVTVPRLAEEAYLRARVYNTSDYFLLPGEAHVFRDTEYIGKTTVPSTASGEMFAVQLGVDDRIRVTRQLVERSSSQTRAGNLRRTHFAYRIQVVNQLPVQMHLTVYDQLPVSRHDDIKVQTLELNPEPDEHSHRGILKWQLDMEPEEEQIFTVAFTLEHPGSMNISGFS